VRLKNVCGSPSTSRSVTGLLQCRPLLRRLRVHEVEARRTVAVEDAAHGTCLVGIARALEGAARRETGDGRQVASRRRAPLADAIGVESMYDGDGLQPAHGRAHVLDIGGERDRRREPVLD
jgi:hypothetical protein